jgi:hypothetical protein
MDLIRNIVLITLGLSAAYLVLSRSREFNSIVSSLTGNWAKLLVVSRGESIPRV